MKEGVYNPFLIAVAGNNFSGRTKYLKSLIQNVSEDVSNTNYSYIGEQPNNFISGIFPTSKGEIDLHSSKANKEILCEVNSLFSEYGFEKHFPKNPFTLSGGEKTILVILCNFLLQANILAIDTTIEQLNTEWRLPLLNAIQKGLFFNTTVYLSDNRLTEYALKDLQTVKGHIEPSYKYSFEPPFFKAYSQTMNKSQSLELINLSFAYNKGENILDKASVYLEPNRIYHLQGCNGAGKTTLAKILTGILKPDFGSINVNDKPVNTFEYPGRLIGYSFQNPDEQIFSSMVENEVMLPLKKEADDYTTRRKIFLEMFGLLRVGRCHPAELPFVIRKRISLAATLAAEKYWYILDEPTLGQDDSFVEFLNSILNNLIVSGKGVIIISHSTSFIEKLKCKKLNLTAGKLTF